MAKPEIRPARSADLAGVLALYRQLHPGDPVLDAGAAETVWSALLLGGMTTAFVADAASRSPTEKLKRLPADV